MLAHKATHEGKVAAEVIAGENVSFDARSIPNVAYTDPEVAWTGLTETQAKEDGIEYEKASFPWAASGRALSMGRDEGFTKLLFDAESHRILGGGIVGTHAGDMIGEVALAIEMGSDEVDKQLRTNVPHIHAIGDIIGQPMLAHKAVHEGHVAAEVAHGEKSYFDARQIPSVAYTDPEVAWAGLTEEECKKQGIKVGKAVFPWAASGRAIANGRDEGFTKILFDEGTHRVIGGGIVGTHAGDLISEISLAIEMGCDAADIGKTIHPHPTLSESIGMAAEVFEGVCTDLPPARKK